MNGHLRLKYGSESSVLMCRLLELSPERVQASTQVVLSHLLALLFPHLPSLPSPNTKHAGYHLTLCFVATIKIH